MPRGGEERRHLRRESWFKTLTGTEETEP